MDRIGRYKIVRELGRGAMGVVYHAIDPNIGRPVAIKTIQLGGGRKPEEQDRLRERLFREARSAGILSHPGIVTIYDVEQQGDLAYIAMEYVDGPTLDQMLSEQPPMAAAAMFSILSQTAAALDYAHQKGIVHRDIKPANIMIAKDGTAKITDFGIAKITASDQFTVTGSIVGTPHYMSPEQVQGHAVDGRSDQFSLAVIAYEMLTGEKPYTGEHLTTVVYKIVTEEPPAPHRLNPSLSSTIEGTLRKSLAKKPDARFRTCQEFVESLEKSCGATKGWKAMPRGGSLNEPTVVEAPRPKITLPRPVKPVRLDDATVTSARDGGRRSGFFTFLLATLVAGGLIALVGLQGLPWLQKPEVQEAKEPAKEQPKEAAKEVPAEAPKPAPKDEAPPKEDTARKNEAPREESPPAVTPAPLSSAKADRKPSPMAPAEPVQRTAPAAAPTVQAVTVITSPAGASAILDGRMDAVCTTPCTLDATPGRHVISLKLAGYPPEQREFNVGSGPMELPIVVMRAPSGTLMLTSNPSGAAVLVNGKQTGKVTPAQLALAPGNYRITLERDGRQATQNVEVHGGLSYLKISLGQ